MSTERLRAEAWLSERAEPYACTNLPCVVAGNRMALVAQGPRPALDAGTRVALGQHTRSLFRPQPDDVLEVFPIHAGAPSTTPVFNARTWASTWSRTASGNTVGRGEA